ncbi:GntR family transcriptional regulator [Sporomusaceae bacterium FL31]|nr:GntR family transcriptional regulator [Sporomusaceae bacterium FL31]GCE32871.1 GntR family transcriptional regulator [Sporomusaceae bacterium]
MAAMYLSIATDIAQRIINDEFAIGSRIAGRTLLASHYNVSSETIRKAVALLKDANVVNVSQGKEITVLSMEEAYRFIEQHKSMQSVYSLRQELEILLEKKNDIDKRLESVLNDIIGYSDRLKNLNPYNPIEIKVPEFSHLVGRTIADIKLWQHTGATVVAIRRDTDIIISPGPLAVIEADDRLVVVGNTEVLQRSMNFVNKTKTATDSASLN